MTRDKVANRLGKGRHKGGRNKTKPPTASQKPFELMDWDLMPSGETYSQSGGEKYPEMGRFRDIDLTDTEFLQLLEEDLDG